MITELKEIKKLRNNGNLIPVSLEISGDLLTPVSAYLRVTRGQVRRRLKRSPKAFLLESVETVDGQQKPGRYSYIGINPICTLYIQDGILTYQDRSGATQRLEGNPFRGIGQLLKKFRSVRRPDLPPFSGGAVGYLGSECYRYLEKLPVPEQRVSAYDAHLALFRTAIVFDHVRQKITLIDHILCDEESIEAGYRRSVGELQEICSALGQPVFEESSRPKPTKTGLIAPTFGKKAFRDSVIQAKKYIRNGDIFQCVLSEQFSFPFQGDSFDVYRRLRNTSPTPYLFYLDLEDEVLLGASPEMLVRVQEGIVQTCPIAGTRPRGKDAKEDRKLEIALLASQKEKAEHLMLVDLGRNDLGRISSPRSVTVNRLMEVQRFSNVMHLVSHIQGHLKKGKQPWDALEACFPAGTLSGAPKIRALEIIAELEKSQRGPYGGAVVFNDFSGRLDSCITIRSLLIRDGRGLLQAGAGIVADSNPDREFDEIMNKSKSIRVALEAGVA